MRCLQCNYFMSPSKKAKCKRKTDYYVEDTPFLYNTKTHYYVADTSFLYGSWRHLISIYYLEMYFHFYIKSQQIKK